MDLKGRLKKLSKSGSVYANLSDRQLLGLLYMIPTVFVRKGKDSLEKKEQKQMEEYLRGVLLEANDRYLPEVYGLFDTSEEKQAFAKSAQKRRVEWFSICEMDTLLEEAREQISDLCQHDTFEKEGLTLKMRHRRQTPQGMHQYAGKITLPREGVSELETIKQIFADPKGYDAKDSLVPKAEKERQLERFLSVNGKLPLSFGTTLQERLNGKFNKKIAE